MVPGAPSMVLQFGTAFIGTLCVAGLAWPQLCQRAGPNGGLIGCVVAAVSYVAAGVSPAVFWIEQPARLPLQVRFTGETHRPQTR